VVIKPSFIILLCIAATLHLYYARFMTHFLQSLGLISVTEPFVRLIPIGVVMGEAYIAKGSNRYVKQVDCITTGNCENCQK
jgi:leucyl-tRNA synthetase